VAVGDLVVLPCDAAHGGEVPHKREVALKVVQHAQDQRRVLLHRVAVGVGDVDGAVLRAVGAVAAVAAAGEEPGSSGERCGARQSAQARAQRRAA